LQFGESFRRTLYNGRSHRLRLAAAARARRRIGGSVTQRFILRRGRSRGVFEVHPRLLTSKIATGGKIDAIQLTPR
jgi:hypothetical protein